MDKPKGNSSNEFNDLFEVKWFFDPLKSLLKKISDKQNAVDIEIKLIKDSINAKADKKDIEDISLKVCESLF